MEGSSGLLRRVLEVVGREGQVVEVRSVGRGTLVRAEVQVWAVADVPHCSLVPHGQGAFQPRLTAEETNTRLGQACWEALT